MIRKAGILLWILLMAGATLVRGQAKVDSAVPVASVSVVSPPPVQKDSVAITTFPSFVGQSFANRQALVQHLLTNNGLFKDVYHPQMHLMKLKNNSAPGGVTMTMLFYLVLGVCFLLALIRMGFQKYFNDLFRAFFSPTLSQRQLKDQLHQTPFPAFALNVFFTISAGIYLYLVLLKTHYLSFEQPFFLVAFFILLFIFIYALKFIILRLCGWLFGLQELMDNYIFTLFLINKILGIVLLPFSLLLAFSAQHISGVIFNISILFITILFLYRYVRVYQLVKTQVTFSKFHFFLYLCAFEVAPLLIVGKLTLLWLNGA